MFSGSALVEDGVMYLYYTGNVLSAGAHDYITSGRGHNTALAVCRDGLTAETNELLVENRDYPAGLSCHVRDPKVWAQDGRYYMVQGARTPRRSKSLSITARLCSRRAIIPTRPRAASFWTAVRHSSGV